MRNVLIIAYNITKEEKGGALLRRTTKDDIESIRSLFSFRKSAKELEWLLSNPLDEKSFRSFVSISDDNRVIGHIGYVTCKYSYNGREIAGVHPISWIVSSAYRKGGIGIELMSKAIEHGDFAFMLGGTSATQKICPFFNFRQKFYVRIFYKILDPLDYFKSEDDPLPKKIAKTLFLLIGSLRRRAVASYSQNVSLDKYIDDQVIQKRSAKSVFHNSENNSHIDWLLSCPLLETHAFTIKHNNNPIGIAVCYVNKNKNILTGRIAHLSYLGDDVMIWCGALYKIEQFLKDRGCAVISTLASHSTYITSLKDSGYICRRKNRIPFFLRDNKKIFSDISDDSWHITFLEGDMGYRGA